MSAPVLSWPIVMQGTSKRVFPHPPRNPRKDSTIHRKVSSSVCTNLFFGWGSLHPDPRAIPFPEVTELFCRLPSSTFFYWPEASYLGDLMRLWVRKKVRINLTLRFSRTLKNTTNTSKSEVLDHPGNPLSKQVDSRTYDCWKEKKTLSEVFACFSKSRFCCQTISTYTLWNINHIAFRI